MWEIFRDQGSTCVYPLKQIFCFFFYSNSKDILIPGHNHCIAMASKLGALGGTSEIESFSVEFSAYRCESVDTG